MQIKVGFEISYTAPQPTPMVIMLSIHPSRRHDIVGAETITTDPDVSIRYYRDSFGNIQPGWERVMAICNYVHDRITFGYEHAHHMKSAFDAHEQRAGVCRDFAHLALTLCRCMGIPARYCTGYMGDIGISPDPAPMDFSGWFEAYLSGQWYTFDARHVVPRIGRIVMATGRDAADVALSTSFGRMNLAKFFVVSDEVTA